MVILHGSLLKPISSIGRPQLEEQTLEHLSCSWVCLDTAFVSESWHKRFYCTQDSIFSHCGHPTICCMKKCQRPRRMFTSNEVMKQPFPPRRNSRTSPRISQGECSFLLRVIRFARTFVCSRTPFNSRLTVS